MPNYDNLRRTLRATTCARDVPILPPVSTYEASLNEDKIQEEQNTSTVQIFRHRGMFGVKTIDTYRSDHF